MLHEHLDRGLLQLDLDLDAGVRDALVAYVELLAKWNQVSSLTAVRDPLEMVTRHILDSVVVAPFVAGQRVLDVGTGAGLPGIVLALLQPEKQYVLLDSNANKARFVTQAMIALKIETVEVIRSRVEEYHVATGFNTVVSRALGTLAEFIKQTRALLLPSGRWLAMKGTYPAAELEFIRTLPVRCQVDKLEVPGLKAERHVAVIEWLSAST